MAFNSAPTAVERQRENVERLKKAFGLALDDEARKNGKFFNTVVKINSNCVYLSYDHSRSFSCLPETSIFADNLSSVPGQNSNISKSGKNCPAGDKPSPNDERPAGEDLGGGHHHEADAELGDQQPEEAEVPHARARPQRREEGDSEEPSQSWARQVAVRGTRVGAD